MNNLVEGPSLAAWLAKDGTQIPPDGGDITDAIVDNIAPPNDDALEASDNEGPSLSFKAVGKLISGDSRAARRRFRQKRRKFFQSCYRSVFTKRRQSYSDHDVLRCKLRRLLLFMQMRRLSRWARSLLMLRAFSWGHWRRGGRCRQPKPS